MDNLFLKQAIYFYAKTQEHFLKITKKTKPPSISSELLASVLYSCYNGINSSSIIPSPAQIKNQRRIASLSIAQRCLLPPTWEAGWIVEEHFSLGVSARKNGLALKFPDGVYRTNSDTKNSSKSSLIGEAIEVCMPSFFFGSSPGFLVFGGATQVNDALDLRVYINIPWEETAELVVLISTELNALKIPFQAKVNIDEHARQRRDTAVVYISKKYLIVLLEVIPRLSKKIGVRNSSPLFTKSICDGISLAADPRNGKSFGQHVASMAMDSLPNLEAILDKSPHELAELFRKYILANGIEPLSLWSLGDKILNEAININTRLIQGAS